MESSNFNKILAIYERMRNTGTYLEFSLQDIQAIEEISCADIANLPQLSSVLRYLVEDISKLDSDQSARDYVPYLFEAIDRYVPVVTLEYKYFIVLELYLIYSKCICMNSVTRQWNQFKVMALSMFSFGDTDNPLVTI